MFIHFEDLHELLLSGSKGKRRHSYPEGASLTELKHPEHTVLKLHRSIELCQVVVIYTQQLQRQRQNEREREVGQKGF